MSANPKKPAAAVLSYSFDKEHVKSWAEEGEKAGAYAQSIFKTAESAVMKLMLSVCAVLAGTPSQEDWLTGYAKAWQNPDTAKSRKTDAKAVFEAYGRKNEDGTLFEYERITGHEKNADGTSKKDADGDLILIRETKPAQDWLNQYDGDFKGFLKLARDIKSAGRGSQGTVQTQATRGKAKVTEKQFAGIMENIPVMGAQQAFTTVTEATKQISKLPDFEAILVNQMEMTCNRLKTSKQPIYLEAAASVLDVLNDLREEVRKSKDLKQQVINENKPQAESEITSPAPAMQKAA